MNIQTREPNTKEKALLTKCYIKVMRDVTPFISSLLMQLRVEICDGEYEEMVACTDGETIILNGYLITDEPAQALLFIVLHEVLHVGLLHTVRLGDRHAKIWNFAADYVINNYLLHEAPFNHLIEMPEGKLQGISNSRYIGLSTEQIYELLMKDVELVKTLDSQSAGKNTKGDIRKGKKGADRDIMSKIKTAASINPGSVPGEVKQLIEAVDRAKLDWLSILRKYLISNLAKDYSFDRPSRRFIGAGDYYPTLSSRGGIKRILVYIDSSGSVSDLDLQKLYAELVGILNTYAVEEIVFKNFDQRIKKTYTLKKHESTNKFKVVGRGGTCLNCVDKDIEKSLKLQKERTAVIVMSDLFCVPMPKRNYEMIWVCINNPTIKVNFGKLIHLNLR